MGKRFGFVRFWEVQNVDMIQTKLEDVWFGTYKLRANLAMHHRGDEHGYKGKQSVLKPNSHLRGVGGGTKQGISFKQSLMNGGNHIQNGGNKHNIKKKLTETQILEGTMEVAVVEENLKKYEKCWVGKLWDQQDVDKIQFKIWMEGFQKVNVIPLGLDLMLLTSDTQDGVKNAVESNSDWWSRCFIEIRPWNPLLRPRGRRVWVRIFGTPLHVWGEDCFNKLVCCFGKLVGLDEATKDQRRLDYARVQVHINGWESVDKLVDIRVGGDLFVVKVVEEKPAADGKANDGGFGSTNRLESNASIDTPDRRWIGDDDGLNGDWSGGGSIPERPLMLSSKVTGFGPVDNNIQQTLLSDTPNTVPVEVCIGEGDLQEKSSATLHQSPTKGIKKGVVVVLDSSLEEGEVGAVVSEGGCGTEHGQHLMGKRDEVVVKGGVGEGLRKEDMDLGQVPIGPNGVEKEKVSKVVELGGEEGLLLKGSCSVWAHNNKFGPLTLVVQHEGGVVVRDSDSEVLRLGRLEEANCVGPLVDGSVFKGPIQYGRRKGGLNSKKKNKNSQNQGGPKCVRFANAVLNTRRPKHDRRGTSSSTPSVEETQTSDPIQDSKEFVDKEVGVAVPELSDMNSFNNNSIIDGNQRRVMEADVTNFRIEAERLFNIGMNLGISSNEDRIALVERLMDSNGAEDVVGDVEVDQ
ncbi:hypothetical protein P8452_53129 [Trifolium repens]|nr:hypothetical protein P8452_53129 [Trifolium repens]